MKKITLKLFLEESLANDDLAGLSYNNLWSYITKDENVLIKDGIIEVASMGINNKISVLDKDKLTSYIKNKLSKRKNSIRGFIKSCNIDLSYSSVYAFIINNSDDLLSKGVVSIEKKGKSSTSIKIVDFDKFKDELIK